MEGQHNGFEGWAILELMGHRRLAGLVKEETLANVSMLRIDIPNGKGVALTQYYHPNTLYSLTPTTEKTARLLAKQMLPEPAAPWELRQLSTASSED